MSTRLRQRARRSALTLLTGATLAVLVSATSATAAPLDGQSGNRGGTGTTALADVWMKDHADDVGLQPHSIFNFWESPDIKVCPTAVECNESQQPVVNQPAYIFVTLRNPGPYAGPVVEHGRIEVWGSPSASGSAWPGDWTRIGWQSVPSYPGTTKVTILWPKVPGPGGHYCLIARWISPNDPPTFESPDIGVTVRHNNNFAQRNMERVRTIPAGPFVDVPHTFGNALATGTRNSLLFSAAGAPLSTAGGRLVADLGSTVYERWLAGGKVGKGVRDLGRNQIEIVDPGQASLDNIALNPREKLALTLRFSTTTVTKETMTVRLAQIGPNSLGEERAVLGGVSYDVTAGLPSS
ncbi:hypothetical protein [Micromonospora okii]|uniref:hypothetical protein n=1 Tax=Micromonospora okii TaxID=1182970 RepID=UPI001E3E8EBC|nr:hypothetical protein [Micromonospora okii]